MSEWTFAGPDGIFTGCTFQGPETYLEANTPAGCIPVAGLHDHLRRRLDIATGKVVPYQPPAPPADDWQTWRWDEVTERWLSVPTSASLARDARTERDRRMAAADWVTLRAMRTGQPIPPEWAAYLQALADVPAQPGFPQTINWPEAPV